ncbi:hypothetical protein NPIL_553691, partial [Nephila pilipes]
QTQELLPPPYDTDCFDYLEMWKENNGTGPLNHMAQTSTLHERYCLPKLKLASWIGEIIGRQYTDLLAYRNILLSESPPVDKNVTFISDDRTLTRDIVKDCSLECKDACYDPHYEVRYDKIDNMIHNHTRKTSYVPLGKQLTRQPLSINFAELLQSRKWTLLFSISRSGFGQLPHPFVA